MGVGQQKPNVSVYALCTFTELEWFFGFAQVGVFSILHLRD